MKKLLYIITFMFIGNGLFAQSDPPPPQQEQEEIDKREAIQQSSTKLILRNNTGKKIYTAVVYWSSEDKSWTSRGWYHVEPYSSYTLPLGSYTGAIYVTGHTSGLLSNLHWGDKWAFCVDPLKAFKILFSDKIDCDKKDKFSKMTVSMGVNKYTFT